METNIFGFIEYSLIIESYSKSSYILNNEFFMYRFNIFNSITLKSFQEQSDKNFSIFLLHSNSIPDNYKKMFIQLEQENNFLKNIFIDQHYFICSEANKEIQEIIRENIKKNYLKSNNNAIITFRIDNDDAVPKTFIENIKKYCKQEYENTVINFPKIIQIQRISDDEYLSNNQFFPSNSIGMGYVSTLNNLVTVFELGSHPKIVMRRNILLLPFACGLQTINGKNSANSLDYSHLQKKSYKETKNLLKENNFSDFDIKSLGIIPLKFKRKIKLFIIAYIFFLIEKHRNHFVNEIKTTLKTLRKL